MAEDNKFSIDMNAEKILFGNMINENNNDSDDTIKFSPMEELPRAEKYQFQEFEPLPESESYDFQSQNSESQKMPGLYVESTVTGINYSIESNFDNITDKIAELENGLGNVSKDMLEAYKTINLVNSKARPTDNFEERVTILPSNLIYNDRVQRSIQAPSWS